MPDEPHAPALMSQATMARAEMLSYKPGGRSSGARPKLNTAKVEEKAAAGAAASGKSARGAGSTRATPRSKISTAGGGASGASPHAAGTSSRASPHHGDQAQKSKSKRAKLSSRKAATTAASSTTSGGGDGGAGRGDDHEAALEDANAVGSADVREVFRVATAGSDEAHPLIDAAAAKLGVPPPAL